MLMDLLLRIKNFRSERWKKKIGKLVLENSLEMKKETNELVYAERFDEELVVVKRANNGFQLTLIRETTREKRHSGILYDTYYSKDLFTDVITKEHLLYLKIYRDYRNVQHAEKQRIKQEMVHSLLTKKERLEVVNEQIVNYTNLIESKYIRLGILVSEFRIGSSMPFTFPEEKMLKKYIEEKRELANEIQELLEKTNRMKNHSSFP